MTPNIPASTAPAPTPSPLRIFLTGGTGFIGSQFAQLATRAGHRVTVASLINNDAE